MNETDEYYCIESRRHRHYPLPVSAVAVAWVSPLLLVACPRSFPPEECVFVLSAVKAATIPGGPPFGKASNQPTHRCSPSAVLLVSIIYSNSVWVFCGGARDFYKKYQSNQSVPMNYWLGKTTVHNTRVVFSHQCTTNRCLVSWTT